MSVLLAQGLCQPQDTAFEDVDLEKGLRQESPADIDLNVDLHQPWCAQQDTKFHFEEEMSCLDRREMRGSFRKERHLDCGLGQETSKFRDPVEIVQVPFQTRCTNETRDSFENAQELFHTRFTSESRFVSPKTTNSSLVFSEDRSSNFKMSIANTADKTSFIVSKNQRFLTSIEPTEFVTKDPIKLGLNPRNNSRPKSQGFHIPNLAKFIPVKLPVPCEIPRILHNQIDQSEWTRAQEAFVKYQLKICRDKTPGQNPSSKLSSTSKRSSPNREFYHSIASPRYSELVNLEYCRIASQIQPDFTAVIYLECPDVQNEEIQAIKTEMVKTALKHFFHPCRYSEVVWISDLPQQLSAILNNGVEPVDKLYFERSYQEKSRSGQVRSLLEIDEKLEESGKYSRVENRLVNCKQHRKTMSILLLSYEAGKLLRHGHSALLVHIAAVLEITVKDIIVLVKTLKFKRSSTKKP